MKKIFIKAESPVGNTALLEEQLYESIRIYLSIKDKKSLIKPYVGAPMEFSEVKDNLSANYVLNISLEERT